MIALLCPTRGRPQQFRRMIESAKKTASTKFVVYIAYQENDPSDYKSHAIERGGSFDGYIPMPIYSDSMPTVQKWNDMAIEAMKYEYEGEKIKLFMLAADDMIFATPGWDVALLDHYEKLENKIHVYHLRDSRDVSGTPHIIVSREYINAMGYFIPPLFLHWFADTWTADIARSNNCFTHIMDYELIHEKPSDKGQSDETHNHIRRMGWHVRDTYVNETCQHFLEQEKLKISFALYPKREWKIMKKGDTVDVLCDPTLEERGLELRVGKL